MGLALRLTFHRAAEILGITTDDVRSLVVEMPRRLPAIYVTQVGHTEPYEWQLLRVDSAGNAFDMSVGGIDGAVHTGFLRIESAALEKFIRDNDLPARHETEFAPHPATEPGAPVPKPQAAAPAPEVAESASSAPSNGLATAQIAALFDAFPYKAEHWSRRLSDTKWLQPAQVALGAAGGATSLWCPATLARLVHARERGPARQKTLEALNRKFKSNPVLQPWLAAWNEYYDMFNDAD